MCTPPLPELILPGRANVSLALDMPLRNELPAGLDESDIEHAGDLQAVGGCLLTDLATLETHCTSADEFVDSFCERLELTLIHSQATGFLLPSLT
jgi:hypothetical protein